LFSRLKITRVLCRLCIPLGVVLSAGEVSGSENYNTQNTSPPNNNSTAWQSTVKAENKQRAINRIASGLIRIPAHISIFSAELIASEAAEKELEKFRRGEHDGAPIEFAIDSPATKELLAGRYYQELTQHLIKETARWYGGKIPHSNGLFSQANTYRSFGGKDFLNEIIDGIDMADIIGSITYYVRVTTQDGFLYFHAINKMSLDSYAGENYFEHDLVNNPESGAFTSTAQVFNWRVEIPEKYRQ